ncbi:hypothetical protein [Alkalihalobacillus sp. BA299]|uniref:hypothetical protein n=1 Tax=Alkalihalobacillus sp. BA299 TaxID=2815938 RepID=UPI001AD96804|nr:hypothetical protein [Alkalihalobacillus sp. BA299]
MFNVYFLNKRDLLLCQLLQTVPSIGDHLTIKGRKSKVASVNSIDEKFYVEVIFENVNKTKPTTKPTIDISKKKKK